MPQVLDIQGERYFLKLNGDVFGGDCVRLDVVDAKGEVIQNFLTIRSYIIDIKIVEWTVGEKLGMFTNPRISYNGKTLAAHPDPVITLEVEGLQVAA